MFGRATIALGIGPHSSIELTHGRAGVVICIEPGANDLHMVLLMPLLPIISCFIKIQIGLAFLVPACPGYRGKTAVKRASVCEEHVVYVRVQCRCDHRPHCRTSK